MQTDFPSFQETKKKLSFATFNVHFAQQPSVVTDGGLNKCNAQTQGGVPIILFDAHSTGPMKTLVASQLTSFKGADLYCGGHLSMGIEGTATGGPAGYSASFVVVAGEGIGATMEVGESE